MNEQTYFLHEYQSFHELMKARTNTNRDVLFTISEKSIKVLSDYGFGGFDSNNNFVSKELTEKIKYTLKNKAEQKKFMESNWYKIELESKKGVLEFFLHTEKQRDTNEKKSIIYVISKLEIH